MVEIKTLPMYIQHDIEKYLEAKEKKMLTETDWWCELYGSINSAYYDYEISKETADYLFSNYLGIEKEVPFLDIE